MIDVLITSSSRPELFPYFWESFKKMCIIRQPINVIVHEDAVFPQKTARVIEWLTKLLKRGEIHRLDMTAPAKGLGHALDWYIRATDHLKSDYCFYLQEDWIFERPIDIDQVTYVMDKNPHINLIFFNKIRNNAMINKQKQVEREFTGMKMCVYHGWTFLPGIWRTDFVRKKWQKATYKPEGAFTSQFGTHEERASVPYCEKKIGAYIYGKTGEHRYVRHIGNNWRMASWRLEADEKLRKEGKLKLHPGGRHGEHMDKPYMAPWVDYPERPVYGEDYDKDELKKMLEEI
jgi:hypothetical protein